MKLEVKIELLKFCSAVFNAVFLVLGLSVAGCAVWILFGTRSFLNVLSSEELRVVAAGLLLIGGVVVAVSVVGCVGANSENRLLLLVYLGFLIILVLGQLYVTLLLLINSDTLEQTLTAVVDETILQYGDSSDSRSRLIDDVQHYGCCCGRKSPADWLMNPYIQSLNLTSPDVLPCSCFKWYRHRFNSSWCSKLLNVTEPLHGRGNDTFDEGCGRKLKDWLRENALTIVGMDVSLMLIQVVQFVITIYLYRSFGTKAALKRTNLHVDQDYTHPDHGPDEDLDYGEQNDAYIDPDHLAYHPDDTLFQGVPGFQNQPGIYRNSQQN